MGEDRLTHSRFESLTQLSFAEKFSRQIRASKTDAAIFYNSENRLFTDTADLVHFALVLLPDDLVMTPALQTKLLVYHAGGGCVLASFRAGLPDGTSLTQIEPGTFLLSAVSSSSRVPISTQW